MAKIDVGWDGDGWEEAVHLSSDLEAAVRAAEQKQNIDVRVVFRPKGYVPAPKPPPKPGLALPDREGRWQEAGYWTKAEPGDPDPAIHIGLPWPGIDNLAVYRRIPDAPVRPAVVKGDGLFIIGDGRLVNVVVIDPDMRIGADIGGSFHTYKDEDVVLVSRDGTAIWRRP